MYAISLKRRNRQAGFAGVGGILGLVVLLGLATWVFFNRQWIVDEIHILTFQPAAQITQLLNNDTMAGRGRDLFLASQPEIDQQDTFNKHCTVGGEKTIVLGCYAQQRIYIYNVTDAQLNGITEVTAAHEMLHAAYERLGSTERTHLNTLLNAELNKRGSDKHLSDLISLYNDQEPGELLNEMHSVLGTEYDGLSPELETYYKQYFTDRSKVVAYSQAYEQVFTSSQNRIASMDAQLAALKNQIDANDTTLTSQQVQLAAMLEQLNSLRASGKTSQYNSGVPAYNANVQSYNALIAQTKTLITQYNNLVVRRNQEAAAQNNLYQSLDSHYQPAAQP